MTFTAASAHANALNDTSSSYSLITLTSDRRLALPVGTLIVLTPTIAVPMEIDAPYGYSSTMTLSIPFKINCDQLGMTSDEGVVYQRKKRETPSVGNLAGGDREMMYRVVEKTLQSAGFDGKACLLRAICEMFVEPLEHYGFFGEVIELFFSPGRKHQSDERLTDYTEAEQKGKSTKDCVQYHKACPYSFFVPQSANQTLH